jgi:hypothetical protein
MKGLPFDVVLHILGFLSVSDLARLIPEGDQRWQLGCKKVLLSRVKQESWQFELYSSIAYFAMLCNPCVKKTAANLICKGYNSCTYPEYLRFETTSIDNGIVLFDKPTLSLVMYCRYWQYPFSEEDPEGMLSLDWHKGHQTYKTPHLSLDYICSTATCEACLDQCNHPPLLKMKINRIMVSLDWFRQRMICQCRNIF